MQFFNAQNIFKSARIVRALTGKLHTIKKCKYCMHTKSLMDHLKQRLQVTGPITVASYMKECLRNPIWGYYMTRDVFGSEGDFITSPEISQMYGELLAVWFIIQWNQMGKPSDVQLVELGPGRGTMMADMLRVMRQFKNLYDCLSIHFVEVSEKMIEMQKSNLNVSHECNSYTLPDSSIKVKWHTHVQDVPSGLSFYLAHEFFDALPVHLFQKINNDWREILVNLSSSKDKLEFVTSPGISPLAKSFIPSNYPSEQCEICPDGAVMMSHISENIATNGGCALIIDYGTDISDRHSIRGFKDHQLVNNILECPGEADLTANVDFSFLKQHTHESTRSYGPITQQSFLLQMGIRERLQVLLRTATTKQAKDLISSYEYLISPEKMGEKFKVMTLGDPKHGNPTAFS